MRRFHPFLLMLIVVLLSACAAHQPDYEILKRAERGAAKISDYDTAGDPAPDDVLIGTDVSDASMAGTGTTKKFRLRDLPPSDPVQAALDAKQNAVPAATDPEIVAGIETAPRLVSPAQMKTAAETHGGGGESYPGVTPDGADGINVAGAIGVGTSKFRDNAGVMQVSNGGGAWLDLPGEGAGELTQIISALNEQGIYPGEIVFTTTGQTFAPVITVTGTPTIEWTFADGSTSGSATPSVDFGSSGTRRQRLKITPWSALYRLNLGYDGSDGGAGDIEHVDNQNVLKIDNLGLAAAYLVDFCASYNPLQAIDFSNFTALDTIELWSAPQLAIVKLTNTPALQRACFENSAVTFLDFSTSPLIADIRGSHTNIAELRMGAVGEHLWHMCVRENRNTLNVSTWPPMNQFPVLRDMWISGNHLTGNLVVNTTQLGSAWLYNNRFTSIDLTGSCPNAGASNYVTAYDNLVLQTITIGGCPGLISLDAHNNALTQVNVDYLLTTLDGYGRSSGTLNLSGGTNSPPSATGMTAYNSLLAKGWTVTVNQPVAPLLESATIGADGETWTFVFGEPVQFGAGGSGGFAITMTNAGAVALTYSSGVGTDTLVYTGSPTVPGGDTVAAGLNYTQPGDGIQNSNGIELASFTAASVINGSQVGPPTLVSATIGIDGVTWTMVFSKAVQIGAGGSGGFAISMTNAGAVALTYASGAGSNTLVYTGDVTVNLGDTVASGLDYTQVGNGIEDLSGYDLPTFTSTAVTNNSIQGQGARIDFTTVNSSVWFNLEVTGAPTVTWHWSDGTTSNDVDAFKDFGTAATRNHYVTVDPPEDLIRFGRNASQAGSAFGVTTISGLSGFPNLNYLYFFGCSALTTMSLANCPSLQQLHLASTGATPSTVDQWIIDVDTYVTVTITDADFYFQERTSASDTAHTSLVSKGWGMHDM